MYASLYLCCIRVGVHIAVAHHGHIAKSSIFCIQLSLSPAFNFRFLGSCMVHPHSLRGVCAGVVVEVWVISLL